MGRTQGNSETGVDRTQSRFGCSVQCGNMAQDSVSPNAQKKATVIQAQSRNEDPPPRNQSNLQRDQSRRKSILCKFYAQLAISKSLKDSPGELGDSPAEIGFPTLSRYTSTMFTRLRRELNKIRVQKLPT